MDSFKDEVEVEVTTETWFVRSTKRKTGSRNEVYEVYEVYEGRRGKTSQTLPEDKRFPTAPHS